ncbi:MAG: zinc-ribbon domain-containing protein, partial [Planctomycetes bacterium]|nr:zinc-ribbon domain-containing protein [Planctomycetota bacterium]
RLTEIEQFVLDRAKDHFQMYGLEIQKLSGLYISMPEEVQKAVDMRSSIQVLGTDYMGYQTGHAVREAANNPDGGGGGGLAGAGVGLGAGMGMGYMMMDSMSNRGQGGQGQGQAMAPPSNTPCIKCQAMIPSGTKFCPQCGVAQGIACPSCGTSVDKGAKFCTDCGGQLGGEGACPSCGSPMEAGAKFCPECGQKMQ